MASAFASRHPRLIKVVKIGILVAVVVGVGIQFVPVKGIGSNPPGRFKMDAPPEVEAILRRACYDCHSNETKWPLYARVAPGSWLMARDVNKGRSRMNPRASASFCHCPKDSSTPSGHVGPSCVSRPAGSRAITSCAPARSAAATTAV